MQHAKQVEILKELMRQVDSGKNIDAGVQYRMPTTSYVCPQVAEQERNSFFRNHPQLIGLSGDLPDPGSFMTMDDFGIPILATRDKSGQFHVFLNACRHRAAKVASDERGTKAVFMCPFHQWSYGNNGELINIPDQDHFGSIDKSCNGLVELPAVEKDGLLWMHPNVDGDLNVEDLMGPELNEELSLYGAQKLKYVGRKTIEMNLNWKLANDTFGETYHFGKLHKNTLGQLYIGNNLHLTEFGRHHRFITANHGINTFRDLPEAEWQISQATFVMYHLFPNIQFIVEPNSATLIRMYPDNENPGRSKTQITFYYSEAIIEAIEAEQAAGVELGDVYDHENRKSRLGGVEASLEVFHSTIEKEDYLMGEMQQRAAQTGMLKEVIFGRNEPALHHFHQNYREALNQPPLEPITDC